MFITVNTKEHPRGAGVMVRGESFIDAVSYYQRIHPDQEVIGAREAAGLKLVLAGCHDTVERQLEALLIAIESIDDDGAIERALQEYVYLDCVGTECAEFVEPEED